MPGGDLKRAIGRGRKRETDEPVVELATLGGHEPGRCACWREQEYDQQNSIHTGGDVNKCNLYFLEGRKRRV